MLKEFVRQEDQFPPFFSVKFVEKNRELGSVKITMQCWYVVGRPLLSVSFKRRPPSGSLSKGWTELKSNFGNL